MKSCLNIIEMNIVDKNVPANLIAKVCFHLIFSKTKFGFIDK